MAKYACGSMQHGAHMGKSKKTEQVQVSKNDQEGKDQGETKGKAKKKAKKKKKSRVAEFKEKISSMYQPESEEELMQDTVSELYDIVEALESVYDDAEKEYDASLDDDRSGWEAMQGRFPRMFQGSKVQRQEDDIERIQSTKWKLKRLKEDLGSLNKATSAKKKDDILQAYADILSREEMGVSGAEELEERMKEMQLDFVQKMDEMSVQMLLIKNSLHELAEMLQAQGAKIDSLDEKVDVISTKLDKAQKMLQTISRKLTSNRLIMAAVVGVVAVLLVKTLIT